MYVLDIDINRNGNNLKLKVKSEFSLSMGLMVINHSNPYIHSTTVLCDIYIFLFVFLFVSIELTLYTLCIHNIYTCISVRPMFVLYVCVYYLKGASHYYIAHIFAI